MGRTVKPQPIKQIQPRRFFTHDRLDLVVKYRFFEALAHGYEASEEQEMYSRHILARTGGIEPGNSHKSNINLYVNSARDLFCSMSEVGFDQGKPIPIDQWGRLRDGAHRVACATVLNLPIVPRYVTAEYPIRQWGIDWFLCNRFSRQYVSGLLDQINLITGYSNPATSSHLTVRRVRRPARPTSRA